MVEQFGGKNDNQDKKIAGRHIGALVGGVLAAGAAGGANAQETAPYTDFAQDSYNYEYGSSYEFSSSPEALEAVGRLMAEVGPGLSVDLGKVQAMVNEFVDKHPFSAGKTIESKDGTSSGMEPSYSPVMDLRAAVDQHADEMNPLLLGLLWKELNKKIKIEGGLQKAE